MRFLLALSGPVGLATMGVGVLVAPVLIAAGGSTPGDFVQGGIAAAAIAFAGATVRYMGAMVDKERARGDRLELALLDKVLPALGAANVAMTQSNDVVKELMAKAGRT
jgi:hypothetical protein